MNHIFRRADSEKYEKEQLDLMLKVQRIFDDSGQRFGAEKIRVILAEGGVRTSAKRISKIMQELGLQSIRTSAKKDYKKRQKSASGTYWNGAFLRIIRIKYGSAILHILESMEIGCFSA